MRRNMALRLAKAAALLGAGGAILQLGSCGPAGVTNFLGNFNPCGSVLNCDPLAYNFLTSGYRGPGANPDIDPFCSYPPFCDPGVDPLVGNLNGGGGG